MSTFITRAYNSFEINSAEQTITKLSKEKRLENEIRHYHSIPEVFKVYFPRLIDSGFKEDQYYLELELCGYNNLGEKLVRETEISFKEWEKIAIRVGQILERFQEFPLQATPDEERLSILDMYEIKTSREYKKLVANFEIFSAISKHNYVNLNKKVCRNFELIWPDIKKLLQNFYENTNFCFFHGDLCFSNILYGNVSSEVILKFIDPRGKFGLLDAYGDPYYDLAKLMHSTDIGYEYFIYDKFAVTKDLADGVFRIEYANSNKQSVNKIFHDVLYSKHDLKRIKLIQGLIYVGMCARHYDSTERQLAMYLSGVKLLNEVLEEG